MAAEAAAGLAYLKYQAQAMIRMAKAAAETALAIGMARGDLGRAKRAVKDAAERTAGTKTPRS